MRVLVTGGAGYVGAVLVPKLLEKGHHVKVLDLFMYGQDVLDGVKGNPKLELIKGDMRDRALVDRATAGCDAVIHLACISNDPSFELDPHLGKSINYDCFLDLVESSKKAGVKRSVYASSSSVYGVKAEPNVTEELPLEPLTDYSKFKAMCEDVLLKARAPGFAVLVLRPATVCGYSPRLRLDLSVNILTNHAVNRRKITVFGDQKRPNIHIDDVCDLYVKSLEWPVEKIDGRIYNAGWDNLTINEIADIVKKIVGPDVTIERTETNDPRSYHISSDKIRRELGFEPKRTVEDAVRDLVVAFKGGKIPNPTDSRYYNIKKMQEVQLKQFSLWSGGMTGQVELSPATDAALQERLRELAIKGRRLMLRLANKSRSSHIGSSLSCLDLLITLYFGEMKIDPNGWAERDLFVMSKAHAAMSLYTTHLLKGLLSEETYWGYHQDGGTLPAHLDRKLSKWIEVSAGSLGHGFNMALGMAHGLRLNKDNRRVYTLIGDGESQEGSIWEGALFGSKMGLSNVTAVMDYNNLQGYGRSRDLCSMEPMVDKWEAFGWQAHRVNGHDFGQILAALRAPCHDRPKILIADTIKGKGVSFMEDQLKWHYFVVTDEHLNNALAEMGGPGEQTDANQRR